MNAVLSGLLLLVAWLTGGSVLRAVIYAIGFFVIATAWNWWRFRQRLQEDAEKARSSRR